MSQSQLEAIVRQFDPLLKSLIGGQPIHRAAVWGQALQESNGNPSAIEKPGTNLGGIGLWQHTGPRRRQLEAFAASRGKPWQDPETQVRFIAQEINGAENHSWVQTQKTTTVEAATETFELDFERPAPATAGLPRRIAGAKAALAAMPAAKTGDDKVTDTSGVGTVQPAPAAQANVLADYIKKYEIPAETVIRQLLVAKGVPGFAVDLVFSIVNPLIDHLMSNVHPDDIGNLLAQHVINPLLSNLTKKSG